MRRAIQEANNPNTAPMASPPATAQRIIYLKIHLIPYIDLRLIEWYITYITWKRESLARIISPS